MKKTFQIAFKIFLTIFLTATTQIGGIIYLASLLLSRKWKNTLKFKVQLIFIGLYLFSTLLIVPVIAPIFGREKITNTERIKPTNYMTILLNRNYVRPIVNALLSQTASDIAENGIMIHYLDANFPFINNFPLLPHLSHHDGKKIDLSLIYEDQEGVTNRQKSVSGYGTFESPQKNEIDQIKKCLSTGHFQYDYPKYLSFGKINNDLKFSEKGTKTLIGALLKNPSLSKIFLEPHLKNRMNLTNSKIRYHGCHTVRHDDHIHLELK